MYFALSTSTSTTTLLLPEGIAQTAADKFQSMLTAFFDTRTWSCFSLVAGKYLQWNLKQ